MSGKERIVFTAVAALTPGIYKELSDERFDTGDLAADALGVAVGVAVSELFHRALYVSFGDKLEAITLGLQRRW
jgi:hypothetical protein